MTRTEIHREDDGELLGFVVAGPDGTFRALSVFGGLVATAPDAAAAESRLRDRGLSVLAETWWLGDEPAVLLEAGPGRVVARVGGVPALAMVVGEADDGHRIVTLTGVEAEQLRL